MTTAVPNLEMNRVEMCVEVLLLGELLATLLTSISYSSMCFLHMSSEITLLPIHLGANRTRPSHFQMNSLHMQVQALLARKWQSTLITCTFLIHVNGFDVLIELGSFRKRLGTIAAIEPHFLMYRLLMYAQITCFSKRLITLITRVFLQIVMNSRDVPLKAAFF